MVATGHYDFEDYIVAGCHEVNAWIGTTPRPILFIVLDLDRSILPTLLQASSRHSDDDVVELAQNVASPLSARICRNSVRRN